jgi:hypothetical protein
MLWMLLVASCYASQATFDQNQNVWILANGVIQANFQLTPEGHFVAKSIVNEQTGDMWVAAPGKLSSPINFQAGSDIFDANRQFVLQDQSSEPLTAPPGIRQSITLMDTGGAARVVVVLELFDNQPVVRYGVRYYNLTAAPVFVTSADMLPFAFADLSQRYTAFRVNQWSVYLEQENFQPSQSLLDTDGTAFEVYSGAHAQHCGWFVMRDQNSRGLFAGWEFDGRTKATARHMGEQGYVQLSGQILDLNHPVQPGGDYFQVPFAFIGLYNGDFDEAGYRTQIFAESALAKAPPDPANFPYVAWDSWGYQQAIDEPTLKQNADLAAALGVELFIVDLGWARSIGDWYEDPAKFPHGLSAISNYAHALGMKFGLHFALTEADPNSPVLQANPDWTSTEQDNYIGASSLCLSNRPTQQWLIQQALHIIDDYNVDWVVQDGENMVKQCTKTTHTHDPNDSNYSNSVEGINAVVDAVLKARPNVSWENQEDGGNMMTFNMVKRYVTSATNDASGDFASRQAVFGATYPFSPRYAERYMPGTDGVSAYATHSYMFGGNWALMNQLPSLSVDQLGYLGLEIQNYKLQRGNFAGSKVFHTVAPSTSGIDVIQSHNPITDAGIAIVTRAAGGAPEYVYRPQGLSPDQRYTVWFEENPSVYSLPGSQLITSGVRVLLPAPYSSDIVHVQRQ